MTEQKENNQNTNSNKPFSTVGKIIYLTIMLGLIAGTTASIVFYYKAKQKELIAATVPQLNEETVTADTTATTTEDTLTAIVNSKFNINIRVKLEGGDSTGILINVSKNKIPNKIIHYEGVHYPLDLDLNSYYLLKFSKAGFITKAVYVNTALPNGREKEEFARFIVDVGLKRKTKDKSSDSINFVGGIKYDSNMQDFNKVDN